MPTQITAHGCEIDDDIREQALTLAERWPRFEPAVMDVSFVFEAQGRSFSAEAIVSRRRLQPVVAKGEGPDFRKALDELDGRITRMLKRDHDRRKDHRHESADVPR